MLYININIIVHLHNWLIALLNIKNINRNIKVQQWLWHLTKKLQKYKASQNIHKL